MERFLATISRGKDAVTLLWKESAKNAMRHEYRKAERAVAKSGKYRTLPVSCSFALGKYSVEEVIGKSRVWSIWLSSWIYGERPSITLPSNMPVPPKFEACTPKIPHTDQWRRRGQPDPIEPSSSGESEVVTEVSDSDEEDKKRSDGQYESREESGSISHEDEVEYGISGRAVWIWRVSGFLC